VLGIPFSSVVAQLTGVVLADRAAILSVVDGFQPLYWWVREGKPGGSSGGRGIAGGVGGCSRSDKLFVGDQVLPDTVEELFKGFVLFAGRWFCNWMYWSRI